MHALTALADEDDDELDDDKDDFSNRALISSGIRSNEKLRRKWKRMVTLKQKVVEGTQ